MAGKHDDRAQDQHPMPCISFPAAAQLPSGESTFSGRCEGEQRQMTGSFDGERNLALVLAAQFCLPPGTDLASIGEVGSQHVYVFVGDLRGFGNAECASPRSSALFSRRETAAPAPIRT